VRVWLLKTLPAASENTVTLSKSEGRGFDSWWCY